MPSPRWQRAATGSIAQLSAIARAARHAGLAEMTDGEVLAQRRVELLTQYERALQLLDGLRHLVAQEIHAAVPRAHARHDLGRARRFGERGRALGHLQTCRGITENGQAPRQPAMGQDDEPAESTSVEGRPIAERVDVPPEILGRRPIVAEPL